MDTAYVPVVGAAIGGGVAFLAAVFTKETKTSEFRQQWIDGLRNDISEFLAHATAIATFLDAKRHHKDTDIQEKLYSKDDEFATFQTCRRRIILRLNPKEHAEFAKEIDGLGSLSPIDLSKDGVNCRADKITLLATDILKSEWKRVAKGEPIFRYTTRASGAFLFGTLLYLGWIYISTNWVHQP